MLWAPGKGQTAPGNTRRGQGCPPASSSCCPHYLGGLCHPPRLTGLEVESNTYHKSNVPPQPSRLPSLPLCLRCMPHTRLSPMQRQPRWQSSTFDPPASLCAQFSTTLLTEHTLNGRWLNKGRRESKKDGMEERKQGLVAAI